MTPRSWDARFTCLDQALARRMRDPQDVPAGVRCAWHRLVASRGRARIGSIVQEVGWSQRHFIAQFTHELGISPKIFARDAAIRTRRAGAPRRSGGGSR